MTTWTLYMQKPQASGAPFAAPVTSGMTIDDSTYQNDPPAIGSNTSYPAGEQQLFVQKLLTTMNVGFEAHSQHTRRGIRWVASSDGGTTFINAYDQ